VFSVCCAGIKSILSSNMLFVLRVYRYFIVSSCTDAWQSHLTFFGHFDLKSCWHLVAVEPAEAWYQARMMAVDHLFPWHSPIGRIGLYTFLEYLAVKELWQILAVSFSRCLNDSSVSSQ
jgi:hypothetical protein